MPLRRGSVRSHRQYPRAMTAWTFEPGHTEAAFRARHMMVTWVRGLFKDVHGHMEFDYEHPLSSTFEGEIDVTRIWTGEDDRDAHLRAPDFFDVENHPQLTLVSTGIRPEGDDYVLSADVTARGVTVPVDFHLEFNGVERDPWGGTRAGFTATAEVNRKDWGLEWNVALEGGGLLVGEKVKINLEAEAVKQ